MAGGQKKKRYKRICYVPPRIKRANKLKIQDTESKKEYVENNESPEKSSKNIRLIRKDNSEKSKSECESVDMATDPVTMATKTLYETNSQIATLIPAPVVMPTVAMDAWQPISHSTIIMMKNLMESQIINSLSVCKNKKDREQGERTVKDIINRACYEMERSIGPVENRIDDYKQLDKLIESHTMAYHSLIEEVEDAKSLLHKRTQQLQLLQKRVKEIKDDIAHSKRKRKADKSPSPDIHILKKRRTAQNNSFMTTLRALAYSDNEEEN